MTVLIVMGVSGVGKSTIAEALNAVLHWNFQEGDTLHPPSNIQKMHAGIPLTDSDRAPWLAALKAWIDACVARDESALVTCSALKRGYRDGLIAGRKQVRLLYLKADEAVIETRIHRRTGHFMPASMLESQLNALQEPTEEEHPIVVDVAGTVDETIASALAHLQEAGLCPTPI